jgi:hypothetical protein
LIKNLKNKTVALFTLYSRTDAMAPIDFLVEDFDKFETKKFEKTSFYEVINNEGIVVYDK